MIINKNPSSNNDLLHDQNNKQSAHHSFFFSNIQKHHNMNLNPRYGYWGRSKSQLDLLIDSRQNAHYKMFVAAEFLNNSRQNLYC